MPEAMGYVLSLPVSTLIIGCKTPAEVDENACIARRFAAFTAEQIEDSSAARWQMRRHSTTSRGRHRCCRGYRIGSFPFDGHDGRIKRLPRQENCKVDFGKSS